MFDTTDPAPGAVPPHVLSALRRDYSGLTYADAHRTVERAQADLDLSRADACLAVLAEARTCYTADTTDNAARLRDATREAAQALLAAFAGLRDRVELG